MLVNDVEMGARLDVPGYTGGAVPYSGNGGGVLGGEVVVIWQGASVDGGRSAGGNEVHDGSDGGMVKCRNGNVNLMIDPRLALVLCPCRREPYKIDDVARVVGMYCGWNCFVLGGVRECDWEPGASFLEESVECGGIV